MIVEFVRGNVLAANYKHIAFAVNTEGHNDAGFAGLVSSQYWTELSNTGTKKLGETMSKGGKIKFFMLLSAIRCEKTVGMTRPK